MQQVVSDLGIKKGATLYDSLLGISVSAELGRYLKEHYKRFCKKVAEDRPTDASV